MPTLKEIAEELGGQLIGDASFEVTGVASLDEAEQSDLSFVLEEKFSKSLSTKAQALVVFQQLETDKHQIVVTNPRKALGEAIRLFEQDQAIDSHFIHEKTDIASNVQLSEPLIIAAFVSIGAGTTIKKGCRIDASVVIGEACTIGENVRIYPNVTIYDGCTIGDNVIIHSGTVIGADGYGYYHDAGKWGKIPQVSGVIIGDNVEIGANSCIDRGCLTDTVIGSGTKIDNLVQIAHNCKIGHDCLVVSQVSLGGSSEVGDSTIIAGQAAVDGVKIGKQCVIYAKAGVIKDVADNMKVSGFPAWNHRSEQKKEAIIRRNIKK